MFLDEEVTLTPIAHGSALTYRVRASSGDYLLRIHSPSTEPTTAELAKAFTKRGIESECAWLRALASETDLTVPNPVPAPATASDGGFVLEAQSTQASDTSLCTLLAWVDGEIVQGKRTKAHARSLGRLLAQLHTHASGWSPPPSFERPTHGPASWSAALPRIDDLVMIGVVSDALRGRLYRTVEALDELLIPRAKDPEATGLIHADLHESNYVALGDHLRPIDFGHCGFGPWLYDVATCVTDLGRNVRHTFLDAYSETRPLEQVDVRLIEGYMVANLVEIFGHHAPNPLEHDYLSKAIPAWLPQIERFIAGEPFMLDA